MAYVLSNGNTSKISHLIKAYCPWGMAQKPDRNRATLLNHCHRDCPHYSQKIFPEIRELGQRERCPASICRTTTIFQAIFTLLAMESGGRWHSVPRGRKLTVWWVGTSTVPEAQVFKAHMTAGDWERKDWMKTTQKIMQENECFGLTDHKVQYISGNTALQGLGRVAPQSVGDLGHKGAECALNNHHRGPNSPWGRNLRGHALLTAQSWWVFSASCSDRKAEKGFAYYDMVTASPNTMCGKRFPSGQLHSFPVL